MLKILILFLCFVNIFCRYTSDIETRHISEKILSTDEYDASIKPTPSNTTDDPLVVTTTLHILSFDYLDDEKMTFRLQLYFRQHWTDSRLRYNTTDNRVNYVHIKDSNLIWTPDTFFVNEIKGYVHDITKPNKFIRISPNGEVLYSQKLSLTLSCPMDLGNYPFDKQSCPMRIESYGWRMNELKFLWDERQPVTIAKDVQLPLFTFTNFVTSPGVAKLSTGEYSYLTLALQFSRKINHYLREIYIPCTMLVTMSWIPFWLKSNLMARLITGISVTLCFSISLLIKSDSWPTQSYTKACDIFTGISLTFAYFAMLQTVRVIYRSKEHELDECTSNDTSKFQTKNNNWLKKVITNCNFSDNVCQILFPAAFAAFQLIYWFVFLCFKG